MASAVDTGDGPLFLATHVEQKHRAGGDELRRLARLDSGDVGRRGLARGGALGQRRTGARRRGGLVKRTILGAVAAALLLVGW